MPELIETTRHKVRYVPAPAWEVGEGTPDVIPGSHYPDDYAGKMLAVLPADHEGDPGGMAEVTLEFTNEQLRSLRDRKLKIIDGRLEPVTFDDRWGAAADLIRAEFVDAEQVEADTLAADDDPIFPQSTTLMHVPTRGFGEVAELAARSLPRNAAHTGTGLYATKTAPTKNDDTQSGPPVGQVITLVTGGLGAVDTFKGGYVNNMSQVETRAIVSHTNNTITLEGNLINWVDTDDLDIYDAEATIQGSLNQLWIDQGVAAFTASQYVRVFAGSYDENVIPNAGLNPDEIFGFLLIMEGDPTDSRANIILDASAGANTILVACDQMIIRHMTITGTNIADSMIEAAVGNQWFEVSDCVLDTDYIGNRYAIQMLKTGTVKDCHITSACGGVYIPESGVIERCFIKAAATRAGVQIYAGGFIHSCILIGSLQGIITANYSTMIVTNCTFYDITYGIWDPTRVSNARLLLINNIFKDVTYPFTVAQATNFWPEETVTQFGRRLLLRNNCFHGYTALAYRNNDAGTKTYAEFIALNGVDAAGDLNSIDPEIVDPASDDFSLEPTSPCRHAGHGSGVPRDYIDNDFHPNTPDIGAWSSEDSVSAVTWPSSLPQIVDQPTYAEGFADVVERSEMDSGPAKVRRRFTSGIQPLQATITVTIAQAATLQTFFDTTTKGGSLEFEWTHPRTSATKRMRFLAPPQLTPRGPAYFVASLALEVLP